MRINEFTDLATIAQVMDISGSLQNKRICITGHLGRPRSEIVQIIESAGGEFHDKVRYDTTHMLTNQDWNPNSLSGAVSSKYTKAIRFGVKIINERQFYDMIAGPDAEMPT